MIILLKELLSYIIDARNVLSKNLSTQLFQALNDTQLYLHAEHDAFEISLENKVLAEHS